MKSTSPLGALFGKSPFRPIQAHMRVVERCVAEVVPLVEAHVSGDVETVKRHAQAVFDLEHEADDQKNTIRSQLPSGLFMPVARRDLLDLLSTQDAIADAAQDVAGILAIAKLRIPASLGAGLVEFVREVASVALLCREMMDRLDELLELGFRGREAEKVLQMIEELSAAESVTDDQGMALTHLLFDHEDEVGALSVVFTYELIQKLGLIADEAENVGDRLRLLVAH
jgi:hypothetical protein